MKETLNFRYKNENVLSKCIPLFQQMKNCGKFCDIQIEFEERVISAHCVILAGTIPYFYKTLCTANTENGKKLKILMKGFNATVVEALIDYCYTGQIDLLTENIGNFLTCSILFELPDVRDACVKFIVSKLSRNNVIAFKTLGQTTKCQDLISAASDFICRNFCEFASSQDLVDLNSRELLEIIRRDELKVCSETEVYEAAIRWVKHNQKERERELPEILQKVRLESLPIDYLAGLTKKERLIRKSLECRTLIRKAEKYQTDCDSRFSTPKLRKIQSRQYTKQEIYVLCGSHLVNSLLNTVMLFKDNQWTRVTKLLKPKQFFEGTVLNKKIYVIGGMNGNEYSSEVEVFDPATGQWSEGKELIEKRRAFGVTTWNNCIYVCGGAGIGNFAISTCECFSESQNEWRKLAPLNEYRQLFDVVALNGFIYSVGGWNGFCTLNTCERYSPAEDKWIFVKPMKIARERLGVVALNGKIYACGGKNLSDQNLNVCEVYDPESDCWSFIPPMLEKRSDFSLAACNGKLYAMGGWNDRGILTRTVEEYGPEKGEWKFVASLPDTAGSLMSVTLPH